MSKGKPGRPTDNQRILEELHKIRVLLETLVIVQGNVGNGPAETYLQRVYQWGSERKT